jgi:hypothetical protein
MKSLNLNFSARIGMFLAGATISIFHLPISEAHPNEVCLTCQTGASDSSNPISTPGNGQMNTIPSVTEVTQNLEKSFAVPLDPSRLLLQTDPQIQNPNDLGVRPLQPSWRDLIPMDERVRAEFFPQFQPVRFSPYGRPWMTAYGQPGFFQRPWPNPQLYPFSFTGINRFPM